MALWEQCSIGSCNRHRRCMYSRHPRCPSRFSQEIEALKAMPDEEIDCSDIAETTDFSGFERGKFHRLGMATDLRKPGK